MPSAVYYLIAAFVVGLVLNRVWIFARSYLAARGTRAITCPENEAPVGVEVDAARAAAAAALGEKKLELQSCTRWPEREGCDQACLSQIESAPDGCLARNILTGWYAEGECAFCGRSFSEFRWHDHKPGLLDESGRILAWDEVPVETLREALGTHRRVCWDCAVAERFRREHPELVVDRPAR